MTVMLAATVTKSRETIEAIKTGSIIDLANGVLTLDQGRTLWRTTATRAVTIDQATTEIGTETLVVIVTETEIGTTVVAATPTGPEVVATIDRETATMRVAPEDTIEESATGPPKESPPSTSVAARARPDESLF